MLDRRLRVAQYVFAVIGLAAAGYLTYSKYEHEGVCGVSAGCTVVQQSTWSELFGIPVSVLGIVGYVGFLLLLTFPKNELARLGLVVGSGIGFLFSMFLMYRAYITLNAFCPFCTTSAVMMTLMAITSTVRFVRGPDRPVTADEWLDVDEDLEEDEDDDATDEEHAVPADGPQGTGRS
ncbi:vitamin K epoxide reductase family protein [Patulibacter minatonensis]|uniref:vitamin K epoxide reductase family protein n=1 Tax=Patulibacter minatonensis TaxID=298163 RepID=UPI000478C496|nr:vitamin K epoxide reductase family protein [Patulibacter minatonensis]